MRACRAAHGGMRGWVPAGPGYLGALEEAAFTHDRIVRPKGTEGSRERSGLGADPAAPAAAGLLEAQMSEQ
jgi:hypothetical protein